MILFSDAVTETEALDKLNDFREDILTKKLKVQDSVFQTSFSFGVNKFQEDDSLIDIIELADKKMYDDKRAIKQRITGI